MGPRPEAAGATRRATEKYCDLSPPELESLRKVVESELTIKKRRDLILDGYEYRKLCFVTDGFAARYKPLRNGKRQIVNFVLPGDVVGLPGSFLGRAAASVVALTDMTVRSCSLEAFVRLCFRWPKFGLALSWLAAQEAANYAEHIVDVGRRTPIERLAHLLLNSRPACCCQRCRRICIHPTIHSRDDERCARPKRPASQSHAD